MVNSRRLRFAKDANLWVQTIGILIAAGWGIYAFVYKEIMAPQSAPTNITVDLSLKKAVADNLSNKTQTHGLIPVEIKVSAKNPGPRTLYLLPSMWIVYGHKVEPSHGRRSVSEVGSSVVSRENPIPQVESFCVRLPGSVVASGGLLSDDFLKPGEVATRTFIIYVPRNEYDLLKLRAMMPTVAKEHLVELEWRLHQDSKADQDSRMEGTMYQIFPGGDRKQIPKDEKTGKFLAPELMKKVELQRAEPTAELSLW
jgi:hypothetical protein